MLLLLRSSSLTVLLMTMAELSKERKRKQGVGTFVCFVAIAVAIDVAVDVAVDVDLTNQ